MVKKTMVSDSTKKEPINMNTISVYGLLPTSEFQTVKCCAEVKLFVAVFIKFHFIKIKYKRVFSILYDFRIYSKTSQKFSMHQ